MSQEDFRELLAQRADAADLSFDSVLSDKLEAYFDLLTHWNNRINLTSLPLEPPTAQTVDRLILEPVVATRLVRESISVWFDLGSGGGSPAIPMQLAHPAKRLIMVESRDRKGAFLREAIRAIPVDGSEVEVSRIESVTGNSHNAGLADLVTVRAVRMDASLFGQIQTLLRFRGQAVLFGAKVDSADLPRGLELDAGPGLPPRLVLLHRNGL